MNPIVTTSWDDTSILNRKSLKILNRFKVRGTFYICGIELLDRYHYRGKALENKEIRRMILDMKNSGHEIGAHTRNHKDLTKCQNLRFEIYNFKKELEELLGQEIRSFSYPYDLYNDFVKKYVKKSGFKYARTTKSLNIDYPKDPL